MKKQNLDKLLNLFKEEQIKTWFDIGLFLDRVRDNVYKTRSNGFGLKSFSDFQKKITKGIAFLAFDFGVDGVSIEVAKYSKIFESLRKRPQTTDYIFWIGGKFSDAVNSIKAPQWQVIKMPELKGFDEWDGYEEYFFAKLERGGKKYNALIDKVLKQTQKIIKDLGKAIIENKIELLFPVNTNSNPGNVPFSLALALLSEFLDIPVINSSHDFYFEDGKRQEDKKPNEPKGVRDHFFTNTHLGEVFSLIDLLFPWKSEKWMQLTINEKQNERLITEHGFSPANIYQISTAVDMDTFKIITQADKKLTFQKLHYILAQGAEELKTELCNDYFNKGQNLYDQPRPAILGIKKGLKVNIHKDNIFILQPTRIIPRKRIEKDLDLILSLIKYKSFQEYLRKNQNLTIQFHITGPIATGQAEYFNKIIKKYHEIIHECPKEFQERIFISFTFGTEWHESFTKKQLSRLLIENIFAAASLIVLPSETEGRGLPILESSACGVPMICSRYHPQEIYADVIGEHLSKDQQIRVFEFLEKVFDNHFLDQVTGILFNPQKLVKQVKHNQEVVRKRYSIESLAVVFEKIIISLWERAQCEDQFYTTIQKALDFHKKQTKYDKAFNEIVLAKNRTYIPGITHLEFMVYLKSLIDPNYFRVEEKEYLGRVMKFALDLVKEHLEQFDQSDPVVITFFKSVESIFNFYQGNDDLAIDHSLSYRHRNRRHYAYRKLTEPELCGLVSYLFESLFPKKRKVSAIPTLKTMALSKKQVLNYLEVSEKNLAINDLEKLIKDFKTQVPVGLFLKHAIEELPLFINNILQRKNPITVFMRENNMPGETNYQEFINMIEKQKELKTAVKKGKLQFIKTNQLAKGIHLAQLGNEAIEALKEIKAKLGFVIGFGEDAFMLDIIDLPSYRIGKIRSKLMANFYGIKQGQGFIQWVPAGLKPSLAYPTPIQIPKEFTKVLKSSAFKKCCDKLGEKEVLAKLRQDADEFGNPIKTVLEKLGSDKKQAAKVYSTQINGIYKDSLPWSGAMVKINLRNPKSKWQFKTAFARKSGDTVLSLIQAYHKKVPFAWNGGYILNPELVGKLGLPEKYIGTPLGLIISNKKIKALPLFNKPAFLVLDNGTLEIKRVNLENGLKISVSEVGDRSNLSIMEFKKSQRNTFLKDNRCFYDLMHIENTIPAKDRVIYRFAGNKIIEVIKNQEKRVEVLPVGITVSIPKKEKLKGWEVGTCVDYQVPGLEHVEDAIEAGPLLIKDGKVCIEMKKEGWKTQNSIATQAARLDYTDMRGPKIGVGLSKSRELIVVAINGRIRESVGATHFDLANILLEYGAETAMGFDPGGSVTVVVEGKQINISPFNKDYEKNVFSLPPEPRFVGNAVLVINE